ncbi:hypothetical protein KC343_g12018 [Hortaea werneckii]|uniref:uS12 prolyl 3,4-dihydroxylase n=1 Tax=Hortaea werneckii TaxID=91943 RepID=A0A3M7DZ59_HORWE|nr:hypothetical protein KC352_g19611 [Hortaea werneckii]KAI7565604.1 hypothetical protein KC317_g6254 [Hortaea werneckii]KAI7610217.1 hypothetical protein KC343_g12018 [Hortaea werneckii]KAI7612620.1 hypothetical protein KC346_g7729 [Hortaea werneckii]KAI7647006.1 hypothetical protein KC319_g11718 [Hortaea werneckii]
MVSGKRSAKDAGLAETNGHPKKPATDHHHQQQQHDMRERFGPELFDKKTISNYAKDYEASAPYKHAVVSHLINDSLLRNVRQEILENIHFTPKETDIYKIHQSGDLANLDGLDASSLERLPSLLKLRDALYGSEFRHWISEVSGAGPVSGRKTDMAVNVYVPGCHLLCHDDVIGSRRVSYILYLTDPDKPWQAGWGGALRLYPVDDCKGQDGKSYKVPRAEWSKVIPPAWNQLSFFAVQPGESFHDVEEVYHRPASSQEGDEVDGGRFRMAISGWFHIPQEGEEGYEPGLEEKLAEKSSLQQLQGKVKDQFDEPKDSFMEPESRANGNSGETGSTKNEEAAEELSEKDLEFLLQYMTPNYLTPDTVEELSDLFAEESSLQLSNFLNKKFSAQLREQMDGANPAPTKREMITSRPPHKHRFQYLRPSNPPSPSSAAELTPYEQLLDLLLPSLEFRKWLSLATGLTLAKCSILARRFRRGLDYQLAQSYEGEDPQLEFTLSLTPTKGWGADDLPEYNGEAEAEADAEEGAEADHNDADESSTGKGKKSESKENPPVEEPAPDTLPQDDEEEDNVGGYELYMAGDDLNDDDNESDASSNHGVEVPSNIASHTGAGDRRSAKKQKKPVSTDPAIYQSNGGEEDDGILFSNPASWNTLSVVLRDQGTLKFVKYVSGKAEGDRWDFTGAFGVEDDGDDDGDDDGEVGGEKEE